MDPEPDLIPEERRHSRRRGGHPTPVTVFEPPAGAAHQGQIIDRSRTGWRLALRVPVAAGTLLRVRALQAPDSAPWAEVAVRWCRPSRGRWELGCELLGDLRWHALLFVG